MLPPPSVYQEEEEEIGQQRSGQGQIVDMEGEDDNKECNSNEEDEYNYKMFFPRGVSKMTTTTTTTMTMTVKAIFPR